MADSNLTPTDMKDLGAIIADGIAKGIESARPKKVTVGQYDPHSTFHPNKRLTPKLKRECFQNGYWMNPDTLFDEEIRLLNRIHRPGRYLDRMVEVVMLQEGSTESIQFRYPNATADRRFENKGKWRTNLDLLQQIVAEQDRLDADEKAMRDLARRVSDENRDQEAAESRPPRESFSSKATREARARVEAEEAAKVVAP